MEEDVHARILDHDGKEITVEELVNRYYDSPADYFNSGYVKPTRVCEDDCGSSLHNSDNSQKDGFSDTNGIEISREDQIEDQIEEILPNIMKVMVSLKNLMKYLEGIRDSI